MWWLQCSVLWFYHSQLLSLENRRLREISPKCIKTWGGVGGKKTKPETSQCCALTGREAMNTEIQKILIIIIKTFFTMQVVKHCKMLPREAVESPSHGDIQESTGWAMGSLLPLTLLEPDTLSAIQWSAQRKQIVIWTGFWTTTTEN